MEAAERVLQCMAYQGPPSKLGLTLSFPLAREQDRMSSESETGIPCLFVNPLFPSHSHACCEYKPDTNSIFQLASRRIKVAFMMGQQR